MFDFGRRVQLALGDSARRTGLKAAAGIAFIIGAGFLIAALWSWLAWGLGWGPIHASLAVGTGFALCGVILLRIAARPRHPMPGSEDLRREIETQVSMAAGAASARAKAEALRMVGRAQRKAWSMVGGAGSEPDRAAGTETGGAADAGRMAALLAAFAVGVALATRLSRRQDRDDKES
ncbi:hypothetical protein [Paracoccus sp. (in: a-proteobacteria)]|uniref:hypothetical protein n=1 Tax=Paracoccus sp. TaxID=267 RepID=UPI003A85EFB5